jgi:outer membrane protein assembly factor BamB
MTALCSLLAMLLSFANGEKSVEAGRGWPQWGGPSRNFVAADVKIAESWPAGGPRTLWRRPIGDGFSGIVTDGTTLYTLYRDGADDVALALEEDSGKEVWKAQYPAPFTETCSERLGAAPRAAPLIAGERLITVTSGGRMLSLDRRTGKEQWRVDLVAPGSAASLPCGYSSSPVVHKDTIITTAGGRGRGVVAIEAATGRIRWATQDFDNGYSSPTIISLDGAPHLIVFTAGEISGLDPDTGALQWTRPHPADYGVNVAMPLWGADNLLFISSAYNGGSRVLKLTRAAGRVNVEELWANKRVRIHFGNAVRIADRVYASNGDFGAAPFAAVDIKTGEMAWRDRSITRSSLIAVGDRLLILDEDGNLVLARPGADALTVLAKAQVLSNRAWTAPTLSGTRLLLRDRNEIIALELK